MLSAAQQRRKDRPQFDELMSRIEAAPLEDTRSLPTAARIVLTRLIQMRTGERAVSEQSLPFFCDVLQSVTDSINAFRIKHNLAVLSPDEVLSTYNTDECDDPRLLQPNGHNSVNEVLADLDWEERSEAVRIMRRYEHNVPDFTAQNRITVCEIAHDEAIRQIHLQRTTTTDRR